MSGHVLAPVKTVVFVGFAFEQPMATRNSVFYLIDCSFYFHFRKATKYFSTQKELVRNNKQLKEIPIRDMASHQSRILRVY